MSLGQLRQTITVVNKSGKVSKQIVSVFKEAKAAYRERKAEIYAQRRAYADDDRRARLALTQLSLEEHERASQACAGRAQRPRRKPVPARPPLERGYTDSFYVNDAPTANAELYYSPHHGPHPHLSPRHSETTPPDQDDMALAYGEDVQARELNRRHSAGSQPSAATNRSVQSHSGDEIDMDLAYGDLPPPLPARRMDEEAELRSRVTKLQVLLDEANCLQHSATATIENLQKNPEALASVGLALAEISSIATKMTPGALSALKAGFPAIWALLASPQFLIAAGVGVGVTVVMLGGYKIIKRIKEKRTLDKEAPFAGENELQELDSQLSHVEMWRRGIADVEATSSGTSVEGEFITPVASRLRLEEGTLRPEDLRSSKWRRRHKARSTTSSKAEKDGKRKSKKKEPSGLKMLFQGRSTLA